MPNCYSHVGSITKLFTAQNKVKFSSSGIAGGSPCALVHS